MSRVAKHADPEGAAQAESGKSYARSIDNDDTSGILVSSSSPPVESTQFVGSVDEGNALVKRLRQLESENVSLATTLTKICEENANLTKFVEELTGKCAMLTSNPLTFTSILHSLFEPEKTGWFGGSKTAARENLEKLSESLQNEFIEYRASHASSNNEVQVLISELQNAYANAEQLSLIVREQQEAISRGPLSVTVRLVSAGDDLAESLSLAELRRDMTRCQAREEELQRDLSRQREQRRAADAEAARLRRELHEQRRRGSADADGLSGELERQRCADDAARLTAEVSRLREALATQQQLHALRAAECKALNAQLRESPAPNGSAGAAERRGDVQPQTKETGERAMGAERALHLAEQRLADALRDAERDAEAARVQLEMQQQTIAELESKVQRSVSRDQVAQLEGQNKSLLNELEIASMRSKHLEELLERERGKVEPTGIDTSMNTSSATTNRGDGVDEAKVLETLECNRECISRLEFEREELVKNGRSLTETIAAKDDELLRAGRTIQEDKQRINFLLKRAVDITAELKSSRTTCEGLVEANEKAQRDISKLRRQVEEVPILQQRIQEMRQKHEALESRLSSVEELEDKLVKSKETIAYMELTQTESISISQYAELQSKITNLENTLEPIKRQREEAKKEVERLKDENQTFEGTITRLKNQIQTQEESLSSLNANDEKLREKSNQLNSENTRLMQLNQTLEQQMENMQDGIKEMAMNFEQERERARVTAENQYRGEIEQLQQKLAAAKKTLDDVKSTQDRFVPEGIHRSLIVEKERSDEENKRKGFDIDKLKSEIIIYRQTIEDLETENEEHVRHIEKLQAQHQKEQGAGASRLAAEQKRFAEAERELDSLRASVRDLTQRDGRHAAQQCAMDEAALKHRRAYEEKCRQEEQIAARLAASDLEAESLRSESESLRGKVESLQSESESLRSKVESLQSEVDSSSASAAEQRARADALEESLLVAQQRLEAALAETPPKKKKSKSAKKGVAALAQVNEGLEGMDVLAAAGTRGEAMGLNCANCAEAQSALARAEEHLATARAENEELLETVQSLTEGLQNAQSDLEFATSDVDKQTRELQQQIRFLERQLKVANQSSVAADAVARAQTLAEDNHRLRAQIDAQQKTESRREASQLSALATSQNSGNTVLQMQEDLRSKDREIANLARELVPTKNKLVEFMAMADRIGIKYPFSAAMEGAAVLRLRAMHFDNAGRIRATSEPRPPGDNAFVDGKHASGKKKRRRRRDAPADDQVSLR